METISTEGLRVLYLEDEPLIAMDTSEILRDLGVETVETVYKLHDAVEMAQNEAFDLALLDINVDRGQTSLDFGCTLNDRQIPVLFVSGNSMNKKELHSQGFGFIGKPINAQVLKSEILALLNNTHTV